MLSHLYLIMLILIILIITIIRILICNGSCDHTATGPELARTDV